MIACALCATVFISCSSKEEELPSKTYKELEADIIAEFSKDYYDFYDIEVTYTNVETGKLETKNTSVTYNAVAPIYKAPKNLKVNMTTNLKSNYKDILAGKIASDVQKVDFIYYAEAYYFKITKSNDKVPVMKEEAGHEARGLAIDRVADFLERHSHEDIIVKNEIID